jgi:hypothetical protein
MRDGRLLMRDRDRASLDKVVFEALHKLPKDQLDGGVVDALEQMLRTDDEDVQRQVLDLLKLERVGKIAAKQLCALELCPSPGLWRPRVRVSWAACDQVQPDLYPRPGSSAARYRDIQWEEFFYRGIIMAVLLRTARSVRQAALIQILLFGLAHIKGLDLQAWIDVISVMVIAVAFTYAAYKTRTLIAGIVFHFLYDALLYLVQVPVAKHAGLAEHALFYGALWTMVGIACLLTKVAAEKLGVQVRTELCRVERDPGREAG